MSLTTDVWRYILSEGRVTSREVEAKFDLKPCAGSAYLLKLHGRGELARFEKDKNRPSSRVQYGVTGECRVPREVRIKEIIK